MASYTKSIMASVFEDTNTHQRFGEAMSNTHQRHGKFICHGLVDADSSRQGTIIHSCKRTAIRFGNVKPL